MIKKLPGSGSAVGKYDSIKPTQINFKHHLQIKSYLVHRPTGIKKKEQKNI